MKILVVSNLFPPDYIGGYELGCAQVCEELVKHGHQVEVLTSQYRVLEKTKYPSANFPVHRLLMLYMPFGQKAPLARSLRRSIGRQNFAITKEMIQKMQPDVIYFWSQLRLTVGPMQAAQALNIPTAYRWGDAHILGYQPERLGPCIRSLYRYIMDNWVYPDISIKNIQFQNVSCISYSLKKELIDSGLRIEDCSVNYNGIPLQWFPCREDRGTLHEPLRLLYVGQLHEYKGVHTAIEAVHLLSKAYNRKSSLSIVGSGPPEYRRRLEKLAIEGPASISFKGKISYLSLSEIYRAHDILIFPSLWSEPQGVTYLEAMASGVAVIGTREGGHGEILRDGDNALYFEKGNAEDLASQIQCLANNNDLYRKITYRGFKEVKENFSTESFAQRELINLEKAACRGIGNGI